MKIPRRSPGSVVMDALLSDSTAAALEKGRTEHCFASRKHLDDAETAIMPGASLPASSLKHP